MTTAVEVFQLSDENWGRMPLLRKADVCVAGGGVAGVTAAIAAAKTGARVVMLEQSGTPGGLATAGLVPCVGYLSDGKHLVASGIPYELVETAVAESGRLPVNTMWQPMNSEIFKRVLDRKLADAGVEVLYGQKISTVQRVNQRICAAACAGANGLKRLEANVFIDATGDGILGFLAGAEYRFGDEDGKTMGPTLCVQYAGIDWPRYWEEAYRGNSDREIWRRLFEAGKVPIPEGHFVGCFQTGETTGNGNLGHLYGVNGCCDGDLSKAYPAGRMLAMRYLDFYRQNVPGFEKAELAGTAPLLGIRETRRLKGDYELNFGDYLKRAAFDDEIAKFAYPVDIHASGDDLKSQHMVEAQISSTAYAPGENYGIPYRALIVAGLDNLLVAGRCISCDRAMQSSCRVIPGCGLTGQAAGCAAALSLDFGGSVRRVEPARLRETLRTRFNAFLP